MKAKMTGGATGRVVRSLVGGVLTAGVVGVVSFGVLVVAG